MTDSSEAFAQAIKAAIPSGLDGVITQNRHLAKLYLASDEEIANLSRTIPPVADDDLRGAVSDWRLISYEATIPGKETQTHILPLGDNARRGVGTKITSALRGIDLGTGLVTTSSGSIYRLVGSRGEGEPTLGQLLQICGALWEWNPRRAEMLGVAHVYY